MSFFHRYRSAPLPLVVRVAPGGILVGRNLSVEIDFRSEVIDGDGFVIPREAIGRLDDLVSLWFRAKLLIDNNDPHADDLMKLKRFGAADPVLFDHGTTGPTLAFTVARRVEEWLGREKWNPSSAEDPRRAEVVLVTVTLDRDQFFYDLA